ncbi:rhomboid family intramembrane serine protease [soil metagenome]
MIPLRDDNPSTITPYMSYAVLALCVLVFLWQLSVADPRAAVYAFGVTPAVLIGPLELPAGIAVVPPVATIFTSMFLHGGLMHLAGNMLYLWIFADNIEDTMGHARFVAFYLLCGVAAVLAQALPEPSSQVPMIGASGAISGVLGAYLLLFPQAHVLVGVPLGFFLHTMRMPAVLVLGLWFALQLVSSAGDTGEAGVAFRAHIGGFIAGMVLIPLFAPGRVALFKRR